MDLFIIIAAVLAVGGVIAAAVFTLANSSSTVSDINLVTPVTSLSSGVYVQMSNIGGGTISMNKIGVTLGSTALTNNQFFLNFPTVSVPMAGYWTYDDGAGTSVYDSSGNSGSFTLTGTANLAWVTGEFGSGLQISSALSNSCVNSGTDDGITSLSGDPTLANAMTGPFTLTVWINTGASSPVTIAHFDNPSNGGGHSGFWLHKSGNSIVAGIVNTALTDNSLTASYTFAANTWYFIAYENTGTTQTIFVNGNQINSGSVTGPFSAATGFHIGDYSGSCEDSFQGGTVDDARVYTGTLTSAQLNSMYSLSQGQSTSISIPSSVLSSLGYADGSKVPFTVTAGSATQTISFYLTP